MTADYPAQPRSALALLAGPGEGPAEAMAQGILLAAGPGLNSALGKLPAALQHAATDEVAAAAAKLLDINLADVLVDGWREQHELVAAARRTLAHPGSTELVKLATHRITLTQRPYVSVLVNGDPWATVHFTLSLVFDVTALQAKISSGKLAALQSGRCDITATLAIQDADVITKQAHLDLPGVIALRQPIRLLPAKDYPADAGLTKTNGGDQGSKDLPMPPSGISGSNSMLMAVSPSPLRFTGSRLAHPSKYPATRPRPLVPPLRFMLPKRSPAQIPKAARS